jgi:hypothetical protein
VSQPEDWNFENGKEKLWYAVNAVGHVFLTGPMSMLPPGFIHRSTKDPKEMDRLFNRMHAQERDRNEKFIEKLYNQRRDHYDRIRSSLRGRLMSSGVSDAEKNVIRESMKLMDEKDYKMQQNTVQGISSMQESEAPLDGKRTRVM